MVIYRIHIPKTAGLTMADATRNLAMRGVRVRKAPGFIHGYLRQYPWMESLEVMSVVRNPWDRFVSLWEHERRRGDHNMCFEDFAKACDEKIRNEPDVLNAVTPDDSTRPRGHALVLTSCRHWLVHKPGGPVHCDYLFKFETLWQDWQRFCRSFGYDIELPKLNHFGDRPDYRTFYNDTIRDIVDPVFKEDCDEFGYAFDPA